MNLSPLDALALGLATFYVALSVGRTHGPFSIFITIRERWPLGGLMTCPICLSIYAAVVLYAALLIAPPVVYVFAAAGGAAFLYRYTGGEAV